MAVRGSGKQGCDVEGCDRPHASKGYCAMHAERVRRYGAPILVGRGKRPNGPTPLERFMAMVQVSPATGCWEWQGTIGQQGYGYFRNGDSRGPAHRRGWELLRGPLSPDVMLDHLCHSYSTDCAGGKSCRHRACVNPDHLEPVEHQTNVDRGVRARQTHCKRGHELPTKDARGRRICQACKNLTAQARRAA